MYKLNSIAWRSYKNQLVKTSLLFILIIFTHGTGFSQSRTVNKERNSSVQPKRDTPPSNDVLNMTVKRIEIKQNEIAKIQDVSFLQRYTEKLSSICPNIPIGKTFGLSHEQLIAWLQSYYGEGSEYMNLLLRIEEDWKSNQSTEN